jgi:hypothetical protein
MPDKAAAENCQKNIDQLTEQINHLRNKGSVETKRVCLPSLIDSLKKWKQLKKFFLD